MDVLVWTTTVLLVLGVGGVAVMKLSGNEQVVEQANRLGYEHIRKSTAVAELFGVAGVVIGVVNSDLYWLGILSAFGIAGMMLGAIVHHRRAGDTWPTLPSILMLISSVLYIVGLTST
jgi:uncharacterized membrane protein YciS (DUF1049 family)